MARGKFVISSSPSGFDIYVNNVKKAYHTPWTIGLPVGDYELLFKKSGYFDWSAFHTLKEGQTINISFTGQKTAAPPPPPPPLPPPPPEKAFFSIGSEPAGGEIWIDDSYTGFLTWKPNIEVSPGRHKIEVKGLEEFVDTHIFRTAYAGETREITVAMAPIPPEVPPVVPPPVVPLEEQFQRPLSDFVASLGLEPPDWLKAWDDMVTWLVNTFGTEWPAFYRDKITGEFKKLPSEKKVIFFVSMSAPVTVGETAAAEAITKLTAEDFFAKAAKDPKGMTKILNALTEEQWSTYLKGIGFQMTKRDVWQTGTRLILDSAKGKLPLSAKLVAAAPNPTLLAMATLGILGIATWVRADNILFYLAGGVMQLTSAKAWDEATAAVKRAMDTVNSWLANPALMLMGDAMLLGAFTPLLRSVQGRLEDDLVTIAKGKAKEIGGVPITIVTDADPAFATIEGVFSAKQTPLTESIAPGKYDITLEKTGYEAETRTVTLIPGQPFTLTVEMELLTPEITPRAGRLQVSVYERKTGKALLASFYINNRLEKATAHSIALDLVPDAYEIRVEAAGYEPWLDTVAIEEGVATQLKVELDKVELPPEVEPAVTCETLGYHTQMPIDGREYEQIPVRGMLCWAVKEPTKGTVEISSSPPAEVWLLGEKIAETTPLKRDFTQGFYTFTLKAEGYKDKTVDAWVYARETTVRAVTLTPEEEPEPLRRLAKVSVNSSPTGAKILVNGVWTKGYTPDSVLLEAGDYEIGLTKSGYKPWATPLRLVEET